MHYVYDGNTKASEDIFRKRWYFVAYRSILPLSPTECSSAATSMIMISRSISQGHNVWAHERPIDKWSLEHLISHSLILASAQVGAVDQIQNTSDSETVLKHIPSLILIVSSILMQSFSYHLISNIPASHFV